jgi:hypothetical protein
LEKRESGERTEVVQGWIGERAEEFELPFNVLIFIHLAFEHKRFVERGGLAFGINRAILCLALGFCDNFILWLPSRPETFVISRSFRVNI